MQYIKFGFGRALRDASRLVQNKHMSREEALKKVSEYDGEFPNENINKILRDRIQMINLNGFTKQEKTIAKEVIKKGKRMIILVNKWDLASGTNVSAELYKEDMYMEFKDLQHYPILFVSALTKRRVSNILEIAWEIFTKQRDKLSTKELNVWIEKAVRNYPPPATQGKSIKIKFVESTIVK